MKIKTHLNILSLTIIISLSLYINIKCIDDATLPSDCTNPNQYYNILTYKCEDLNYSQEFDNKTFTIRCAYGFYYNNTNKNCTACDKYKVSSGDRTKCVQCANEKGVYNETDYGHYNLSDTDIYTCNCKQENSTYPQIEFDKKGNSLEYQYCNKIPLNFTNYTDEILLQSDIITKNGKLTLIKNNDIICSSSYTKNDIYCIPKFLNENENIFTTSNENFSTVPFYQEQTQSYLYYRGNYKNRPTRDSDFVSYTKRPSQNEYNRETSQYPFVFNKEEVSKCLYFQNQVSCEIIKNNCSLTLYSTTSEYCKLIDDSEKLLDKTIFTDSELIPFPVNVFDTKAKNKGIEEYQIQLKYFFKAWDINGNYLGEIRDRNPLILCSETYDDKEDFKKVGVTLVNECFLDTLKLLNESIIFYEMYLETDNEPIQIPVIIDNEIEPRIQVIKREEGNNDIPNLYKRFFLFNIFHLQTGIKIVYAKTIKLKVTNQNKKYRRNNRIFIPYLRIEYFAHAFDNDLAKERDRPLMISFRSEYNMDERAHIIPSIYTIFYIFLVITGLFVVIKMCIWSKIHTYNLSRDNYFVFFLINFFIYLFKYTGLFLFIFTWVVTFYWYVFYKLQFRAYVFLPDLDLPYRSLYKNLNIVWGIGCCSYFIYMLSRIYDQLNYDVFFIDWEHDKDLLINYNANNIHSSKYRGAWRAIHIANQFNILQKERTISISICFGFLIMLWYYHRTHWNQFAQMSPNVAWVEHSPENMFLRHFITTFVLVVTGLVQYFLRRILNLILIPLKKNEFLDLCSVANISVIILDDKLHGYYIHGQSPFGKADTNFVDLIQFLEEERKGKIRGRGLTGDEEDNLQSYEIYLSNNMRDIYDDLYYIEVNQEINAAEENDRAGNQSRYPIFFRYIPKKLDVDKYYHLNNYMNTQLKNKIQQVASQSKIFVKERSLLERFLQLPPNLDLISANARELVFFKDPGMNFDNVCFTGMEIEWLIMVCYVFQMWCISLHKYSDSLPIAIFMTYLMEKVAFRIRVYYGEKNVARKAVIDNRFL